MTNNNIFQDGDVQLVDICGTQDKFHKLLLQVASFQHAEVHRNEVFENLRFLTVLDEAESQEQTIGPLVDVSPSNCSCTGYRPAATSNPVDKVSKQIPTLVLTEPGELAGCSHYIAVSYCWQQTILDRDAGTSTVPSGYLIQTAAGCRPNRTPASVLHHALRYAASRSCRFVWIDQECIDQTNPAEKEFYIQGMHLIYRSAEQVVALLNCNITAQAHIDVLGALGVADGHAFKVNENSEGQPLYHKLEDVSFLETAVELAEIIAGDLWYTRAWTLQEAILASLPLYLLVPYDESLEKPDWAGEIPGQLILSEAVLEVGFARTFFWRLRHWERSGFDDKIPALQAREKAVGAKLRGTIPDYKTYNTPDSRFCRQAVADAVWSLMDRQISEPSDLIAIIGNLCQYSIRLDTRKVRAAGISFTMSIFALALLNGDMSLMIALEDGKQMSSESNTGVESIWHSLPSRSLRNATGSVQRRVRESHPYDCLVQPPTLTPSGLIMSGFIYVFGCEMDLQCIRDRYSARWEKEGVRFGLGHDIFWAILEHLLLAGQIPFLQALFRTSRFSVPPSLSSNLQAALKTIRSNGGTIGGEQWLVSTVMSYGKIRYGAVANTGCTCLEDQQAYILLRDRPRFEKIFVPRRVLGFAEHGREEPDFLLSWSVRVRNPQLPMDLECTSSSFTILCQHPARRDVCVVGYRRHFSECPGQQYSICALRG